MQTNTAVAFGENVRAMRKAKGWSQAKLAEVSGISQSAISYAESYKDAHDRHAGLDVVEALARAFGVSPVQMLFNVNSQTAARNLLQFPQRNAQKEPSRPGVNASKRETDTVALLRLILQQVRTIDDDLTARQRDALVVKVFKTFVGDEEMPTSAKVRQLVRSA